MKLDSMKAMKAIGIVAAAGLWMGQLVSAKSVFCHYMIGTVNKGSGHAELDVDQAKGMGIDAFALNLGQPSQPWAQSTIQQLFDHADNNGFKLFFSLDLLQTGDINAFTAIVKNYIGRPSYLKAGPNANPVISTFSTGALGPSDFQSWKNNNFGGKVYFLPNADRTQGYGDPKSWFPFWNNVVDGVFGWETAWPNPGNSPTNISSSFDAAVQDAAHANGKTYMAPLSSLQYKKCCGGNYYRIGEVNLPQRMSELLSLKPDFVEVITWNDAGESHYIGNNWAEGLPQEILAYSDTSKWPHYGWQPVIQSFITAYKNGGDATSMRPPGSTDAVGAMWYRPILKSANCQKPDNWQSALDAVNYAVVVGPNAAGLSIRVTSGSKVISERPAQVGLNYAAVTGINIGAQKVELVRDGRAIRVATSLVDVVQSNNDCFFNYQVAGLA